LFRGEWATKVPAEVETGVIDTAHDQRLARGIEQLGGVAGKRVLELGPLEAGHTWMLEQAGAQVTAIEANGRAYLKCLIVKEVTGLRARFWCGDFLDYLRSTSDRYDVVIAAGVLYHQLNPVELLTLITRVAPAAYIQTHYHDPATPTSSITSSVPAEFDGFRHTWHRHQYGAALDWPGYCGGGNPYAHWLSRADLLGALRHVGFGDYQTFGDEPTPNGPTINIVARRPPRTPEEEHAFAIERAERALHRMPT
jgi:hypothetical protein